MGLTQNTKSVPSQYDTTIIAELGQILNIYQSWIDLKKKRTETKKIEETEPMDVVIEDDDNEQDGIKELFGDQLSLKDDKSDFYSRLLDEVKQKAMDDHNDHDYYDDNEREHNPKDLVMDYIGLDMPNETNNKEKEEQISTKMSENVQMEEDDLYDYEYSDDSEDEFSKKECVQKQAIAYDEDTGSHKDAEDENEDDLLMDSIVLNGQIDGDKAYISPSTEPHDEDEDDALYQYDDEEDESQHEVIEYDEPKKDENNEDANKYEYDYDDEEEDEAGDDDANIQNVSDKHFYNAH